VPRGRRRGGGGVEQIATVSGKRRRVENTEVTLLSTNEKKTGGKESGAKGNRGA